MRWHRIFYAPDDAGGAGDSGNGAGGAGDGPDISGVSIEQVTAYLDANSESDAVKAVASRFNPLSGLTDEGVDAVFQSNPLLLKHRNAYADQQVTKGIQTWRDKHFDEEYQKRFDSENPPESEEAKRLRDLEQRLASSEKEQQRSALQAAALKVAGEKNIPSDLVGFFLGDDDVATVANLELLNGILEVERQKVKDQLLDRHGRPRVAAGGGAGDNGAAGWTADQIEGMSMAEVNQNWDKPGFQAALARYRPTGVDARSNINR